MTRQARGKGIGRGLGLAFALLTALAPAAPAADGFAPSTDYSSIDWVVDSALGQPHLRGADVAVLVVSASTGAVLYERSADLPLIPASNMKVVTGAAALSVLGPDHRFETTLTTDAASTAPVLDGSLYVLGSGDPSFVSEELWKLVDELRVLGITRIAGDIVLDASYFDSSSTTSDVVAQGDRAYHARTGALSLNFNSIAVHTSPGDDPGDAAVVRISPATSFVELRGDATTGRAGGRSSLSVKRTFESGRNVVTVTGSIPVGSDRRVNYRNLDDGIGYFGTVLLEFLAGAEIEVEGVVRSGAAPEGARILAVHRSKPLSLVVRDLNKYSNNFVAEQLLKAMSARADGTPGTTGGGVRVLEEHLRAAGADSGSFMIRDGSGFSRENRLTATAIVSVIRDALSRFDVNHEFAASLSVSGTDGTLEDRMGFPGLSRAVRAKTGLLDGVTAISGIVRAFSGEDAIFSIIVNGFECEAWRAHDLEHSILTVVARG